MDNQFLKTKKDIQFWLESMKVKNYTINDNLVVDVANFVNLENKNLTHLPIQFGIVKGYFRIGSNKLSSMLGFPSIVEGDLEVQHNQITSLNYLPNAFGTYFLSYNKINSLLGLPKVINGNLMCSSNELKTLQFCPEWIKGKADFSRNEINTLEFCPKEVGESLRLVKNKITKINAPSLSTPSFVLNANPIKQLSFKDIENIDVSRFYIDENFINKKGTIHLKKAVIHLVAQNQNEQAALIDFKQFKEATRLEYEKSILEKTIKDNNKANKIKL
jgi:hypothetical protein